MGCDKEEKPEKKSGPLDMIGWFGSYRAFWEQIEKDRKKAGK